LHRLLAVIGCCFVAGAAVAEAPEAPSQFANCATLKDCLHALDSVALQTADGSSSDLDAAFATRLEEFGRAAKKVLLKRQIARFPRAAFDLSSIGRDVFVAWSGGRAIVFSPDGIAGVAPCVAAK
jgi:hypothetical protein